MAMGKVVIVTEALGAPDYMQQGVSGFYTDYADWKAVRRHIVQVMEDAELRRKVGQAARERAWREFSPDAFRSRVLALLEAQPTELAGSCS
jgi:glycosyltransferase involved in cell wall biosynthesis